MYKVNTQEFDSFDEVIQYAWNTFKLSFEAERELTEDEKHDACRELEDAIDRGCLIYIG